MNRKTTILMCEFETHDVKRFVAERPEGFDFEPGQGVELALDREGWREKGRPFTPTSLTSDRVLEFTIKRYSEREGVTDRLHELKAGDDLLLSEPFGTIRYQGPGTFLAGGAGVTPFLAIIRELAEEGSLEGHTIFFANKTAQDVICEKELRHHFGDRCHLLLSRGSAAGFESGRITRDYLDERLDKTNQHFYLCGPPEMVDDLKSSLRDLGVSADRIVHEE